MGILKSSTAILVAMAMVTGTGTMAFATTDTTAQTSIHVNTSAAATVHKEVKSSLEGMATIEKVNSDKQVTVKVDDQTLVLNIGEATLFIDAKTGIPSSIKDLKAGDNIYVTYSAAMTRSLPPQSSAIAVVTGVKDNQTIPRLMTVKEVVDSKENQIRFLNTDEDMFVTILKNNPISPFKTKQIVTSKDVQAGSRVFVWYDIVLESYPGQTTATKTVLVDTAGSTVAAPTKITINGNILDLGQSRIIEKNSKYLVPLKIVSKALDFNLSWDAKARTASIDNGVVKTTVTVGKDAYYKVSSKAIGLTNTFAYGVSPEIIDGTLYVPSDFFNLLYSNPDTVVVTGDLLAINTLQK